MEKVIITEGDVKLFLITIFVLNPFNICSCTNEFEILALLYYYIIVLVL